MNWMTNEYLFYGGIFLSGCSLLAIILHLCIFQIKKIRLDAKLVQEYGEKKKK